MALGSIGRTTGSGRGLPSLTASRSSMETTLSALSMRPLEASQRGDSGMRTRMRDHQHGGHEADDEQGAPAVERDEEVAGEAGEQQTDREDELVEQEEPAALLRADELVDVGRGDGDLAAGADALEEAEDQHGGAAPGEQAGDVHRDEQHDGDEQGGQAADLLGDPAEQDRADELAEVAGGEDEARPRRG